MSIGVGIAAVLLSLSVGVGPGLVSGRAGGRIDASIMRAADIQRSFPAIMIALPVNGVLCGILPGGRQDGLAIRVPTLSIGISGWVQYARAVRGSTLAEKNREHAQAARLVGISSASVMRRHILPDATGPVLAIATIHLAVAIITEATPSFLGIGAPPTEPSPGTLIRIGNDFPFSGEWRVTILPGASPAVLVLSVNLPGDWLRDALNPERR